MSNSKACFLLAWVVLSGCGALTPSTTESRGGLGFPLAGCTPKILAAAVENLSQADRIPLKFTNSIVCVTDTRVQAEQRKKESPAGRLGGATPEVKPVRDSSSPPIVDLDPSKARLSQADLELQARAEAEEEFRNGLEGAFLQRTGGGALGIALSGGGSKAAAFGSGVLAGLADADLLDSATYISTVSGGGYAAYFYYTHKIFPYLRGGGRPVASSVELFRDCVRRPGLNDARTSVRQRVDAVGGCTPYELQASSSHPLGNTFHTNRHQAFVKCQQDVLQPGKCSIERTTGDLGVSGFMVASTLLTAIPSYLSTVIFDWGLNTSPAAQSYRDGIGLAYGSSIRNASDLKEIGQPAPKRDFKDRPVKSLEEFKRFECAPNKENYAFDCLQGPGRQIPDPLRYEELLQAYQAARRDPSRRMPFWIMNAVAPSDRSMLGWWSILPTETSSSDIFEMTAVSHGSGRYGYVAAPISLHGLTVLDSVGAAAAFLDPNQNGLVSDPVPRGLIGVAQRMLNVDWGIDISNYNVSDSRRTLHTSMPFPFFDAPISKHLVHAGQPAEDKERVGSVFIRLIDGGNGENLGAHALLKRGTRNIVISDAGADKLGNFLDLCELRRRLSHLPAVASDRTTRNAKYLYVPGLPGLAYHCDNIKTEKAKGYGVHDWPFTMPVLFACVRKEKRAEDRQACAGLEMALEERRPLEKPDSRLFVVKPALNIPRFRKDQLQNFYTRVNGEIALRSRIKDCWLPQMAAGDAGDRGINCETAMHLKESWDDKDGNCQSFPQHSTITSTANSSNTIYAAYRELARQYTTQIKPQLAALTTEDADAVREFEQVAAGQFDEAAAVAFNRELLPCNPKVRATSSGPAAAAGDDGALEDPRHGGGT
jgi:hypothetical protein